MTDLVQSVLADRDNDLAEIVRVFKAAGERCWHIDRHVIGATEAQQPGPDLVPAACAAAIALARHWFQARILLQGSGVIMSAPTVVIDDQWLAGAPMAPPPHVYICLATDRMFLATVRHGEALPRTSSGITLVDTLLTAQEMLSRLEGEPEGDGGAWFIDLLESDPPRFTITWSDQEVRTDAIDEVEAVLDRVDTASRSGQAILVTVQRVDGRSLSIGLGRDLSVLTYVGSASNPPYFVSARPCDADGTITFFFHGHASEFHLRNAISAPSARRAMHAFCITGSLSTDVGWEEV
jgi:hypothetical protein